MTSWTRGASVCSWPHCAPTPEPRKRHASASTTCSVAATVCAIRSSAPGGCRSPRASLKPVASSAPACAGPWPAPTPSSPCAAAGSAAASRISGRVRLFFVGGRISLCGGEAGGNRNPSRRGEGAAEGTGDRWYLCRQRRLGVFRWYSRAWWKVSVRINAPAARGGLRTVATAAKCHRGPGRLPSGRGPNADRPFNELATSTAPRIAAATWIMSSTTVASRAYAVVPAKRSRWSRGGAYRPRSAPAAGSARHRADAGRRDRAARSPDPQPASCRRSFRRGYRARAAPSTRHHWHPRPDRRPVPGCVGRDVLAGACVPTSGPAGAVPVRVRSRSSAGLRWRRGRLWHPRRQHRPLHTGPGSGDRCGGRRFAPVARRIYVPGILSSQPSQVCLPAHGTVPERRANVQKGARLRGTDRRCSAPFRGSAGRRKDAGAGLVAVPPK